MNHEGTKTPRPNKVTQSHDPIPDVANRAAAATIHAALRVHSSLGPGLLESVYETCLAHELAKAGHRVERQVSVPITYDGLRIDAGLRLDLVVDDALVVELKAVEVMLPVHHAQVLTYLKVTGHRLGLLINFNVPRLKDGIRRLAN